MFLTNKASSSSSLIGLRPFVGLGLLHVSVAVSLSGVKLLPHAQTPTWRASGYASPGPYALSCLASVALPGAYAPASITLQVIGKRKRPLYDTAMVPED
jgi:hypothetical protein